MSLNETVSSERLHIGFFGLRNAGKSSLVNAVTGQNLSVVSEFAGTTTDPLQKAMELLPIGPVVISDTPGIDDEGTLGALRVERALRTLDKTDIAVLVVDSTKGLSREDKTFCEELQKRKLPYVIAFTKCELLTESERKEKIRSENELYVSAATGENITELKEMLAKRAGEQKNEKRIVGDHLSAGDRVILVTPIDEAAPKGRLILPQQQTLRDILDSNATALVCRETELSGLLASLKDKPKMVITDSQVFGEVNALLPKDIPLTSFSILFARYKGNLQSAARGAAILRTLSDGDTVLISEGCTHHRQCNDIGTVKLPKKIRAYCGKDIRFAFTSGGEFPADLSPYALVVHCGGCMLNQAEMCARAEKCARAKIPMTNYGIALAEMNGILRRSIELFPDITLP